jgi:hypothetical protein
MTKEELKARVPEYIEPFDQAKEPAEDHKIVIAASISHFSENIKKS